jgi:nucleoside-diphosphate-sugar epimerase
MASAARIVVTGASGRIGRRLVPALARRGAEVTLLTRSSIPCSALPVARLVSVWRGDLTQPASLRGLCSGADWIIHCAGPSNGPATAPEDPALHDRVTVEGTRTLFAEASRSSVRGILFLSTVKVMGEESVGCGDERRDPRPESAYGHAKLRAEKLLLSSEASGPSAVVLRLPPVYGPGGRGALDEMIGAIARGRFPPPPELGNRRSLVHIDDVVQAVELALQNQRAQGQVYFVTDGGAYSTREIYLSIRHAFGKGPPRWAVPLGVLELGARTAEAIQELTGTTLPLNRDVLNRLTGSAWFSNRKICDELGFAPRFALADALPDMVLAHRHPTRFALDRSIGLRAGTHHQERKGATT